MLKVESYFLAIIVDMIGIHRSRLVVLATYRSPTLSRNAVGGPVQPKGGLNRRFEPPTTCFKNARL